MFALGLHPILFANIQQNIVCKNASFCLCSCLFYCKNLTTYHPERSISRPIQRLPAAFRWETNFYQYWFFPCYSHFFCEAVGVLAHYYSVTAPDIFCCLSWKNWKFLPPPKSANTFLRGQKNLAKMILFVVTRKILMCGPSMYFFQQITWKNIGDWKSLHLFLMVCAVC